MIEGVESKPKRSVIVIGGGIAGISTALYLAEAGMQVTCLEANDRMALETSFMNGSLTCASRTKPWCSIANLIGCVKQSILPINIEDQSVDVKWSKVAVNTDFWNWVINLAWCATSKSKYTQLFQSSYQLSKFSLECMADIDRKILAADSSSHSHVGLAKGTIQLFPTETERNLQLRVLSNVVENLTAGDAEGVPRLDPVLAETTLFPGGFIHSAMDRSYDIYKLCLGMKDLAERKGVRFVANQHMQKVELGTVGDNTVVERIVTDKGTTFKADAYVVAMGNHSNLVSKLVGDGSHSWPVRGFALEVPLATSSSNITQCALSHNVIDDLRKVYISPLNATAVRLSGYCEIGPQYPDKSQYVDETVAMRLLDRARALLPTGYLVPSTHPAIRVHTCWRPQTPDDLPVVGASAHVHNLYYNSGHGHLGLTRAVGSAKLLSEVIVQGRVTSTESIDMNDFRPDRFLLFNFCQVSRMLKKIF